MFYRLQSTSGFERSMQKLKRKRPEVEEVFDTMKTVLEIDPFNISRQHPIKKLTDIAPGEGQWSIRRGPYRMRYDIEHKNIILYSMKDRSDAYRR